MDHGADLNLNGNDALKIAHTASVSNVNCSNVLAGMAEQKMIRFSMADITSIKCFPIKYIVRPLSNTQIQYVPITIELHFTTVNTNVLHEAFVWYSN